MKHLVLGSEGQIGGHLLNYLKKTNEEVVEFDIRRTTAGDLRIYNNEHLTPPKKELVELIVKVTGFEGEIKWDTSKPDGQLRRCLDVSRAKEEFGFETRVNFREGLKRTIGWYKGERRINE